MSRVKYLHTAAKENGIPVATFRDMDRLMEGVMRMTHYIDNTELLKIMVKRGWTKDELKPTDLDRQTLKELVMRVMFYELCMDNNINEDCAYAYIRYWNEI
jgi:hypothetical protein